MCKDREKVLHYKGMDEDEEGRVQWNVCYRGRVKSMKDKYKCGRNI